MVKPFNQKPENALEEMHKSTLGQGFMERNLSFDTAPNLQDQIQEQSLVPAPITKQQIRSEVRSIFDARPINNVDTFGVNPVLVGGNVLLAPASIPITFEYKVNVPFGRTYILREFYFVPTRFLYDSKNNPIQDLFKLTFKINGAPVAENSGMIFPSWGTGGWVDGYFVAPENSIITLEAKITNATYVDLDPSFQLYMGASVEMRFNALLNSGAPAELQPGNILDLESSPGHSGVANGLAGYPFANKVYQRPK